MKIIYVGGEETAANSDKYSLCLGMFDGVHKGHRALIEKTIKAAKELNIKSGAVTFVGKSIKNRIYLIEQQAKLFEECGTDTLFVIQFDDKFRNTPAEDFIDKYIISYMKAAHIVCGRDFTFGINKSGDTALIEKLSAKYGYSYEIVEKISEDGRIISSTYIRELLKNGCIKEANKLLGKAFGIEGCVCEGHKIGRTIGFPTINISINDELCDIGNGVYESSVVVDGREYAGITNIGSAPTVRGDKKKLCETYIIGGKGNLYNKYVYVRLVDFLRQEKKFNNTDELKRAISENLMQVCSRRSQAEI